MTRESREGSEEVELSIIVVNTQHKELLEQCLHSLERQIFPFPTETIVVDNCSSDGSIEMVKSKFPAVRLKQQSFRKGPAANYNAGFRMARGKFVVGLNEDAEVCENTLALLHQRLIADPEVACAAPRLTYPDGSPQLSCGRFPDWTSAFKRLVFQKFFNSHWVSNSYAQEKAETSFLPDWIMATCLMYRRTTLEEMNYYDESLVVYYEELDMARRLRTLGRRVAWVAEAVVRHHHGVSNLKLRSGGDIHFRRLLYQSRYRYFRKHKGFFYSWSLRLLEASLFLAILTKNLIRPESQGSEGSLKLELYRRLFIDAIFPSSLAVPQPV